MLPSTESIQIILPIVSIAFLILSFKRTIYGVIAYFIILNAKLGDMYPALGAIRFELVAAIIVFISIFLSGRGIKNCLPQKNILNKSLWILFVVGMLSVPQAVDVSVSWQNGGYFLLKLTLFYIMLVLSINDYSDLRKMIWAFVLVTAWVAYEPVTSYLSGLVSEHAYGRVAYGRFGAAAGHVALANTLNQGIPITFFLALSEKGKKTRLLLWILMSLLIIGVVFSKSRGGFIGLIMLALGLVYFSKNKARAFVLLAVVLFLLLPLAGQKYLTHISTITHGIHSGRSSSDRYWGLVNGISMMIKRPILGVGIGCYAEARKRYFNYYFYAHNLYGELFGELGIASAVWFYWIYMIFKKTIKLKKLLDIDDAQHKYYFNILNGIQLGLFLRLFVGNFSHSAFIWFWFLMAALTVGIENITFCGVQERKSC